MTGVLLLFIFAFIGVADAHAANVTSAYSVEGFTVEEAKERYYKALLRNCAIEDLNNTPVKEMVVGNDWVAVCTIKNTVGVFDLQGNFIYGIRFNTDGAYSIFTDISKEDLYIFIARNGTAFSYRRDGTLSSIKKAKSEDELASIANKSKSDFSGNNYVLKREGGVKGIFGKGYTKVWKISSQGERTVFYDSGYSVSWLRIIVIILIGVGIFVAAEFISSFPEIQKKQKDRQNFVTKWLK